MIREKLVYYPTVTREPFQNRGRVTDLVTSGQLFTDVGMQPFDAASDRVMLCGSPQMLEDMRHILETRGFKEGANGRPAEFVVEKAFVVK